MKLLQIHLFIPYEDPGVSTDMLSMSNKRFLVIIPIRYNKVFMGIDMFRIHITCVFLNILKLLAFSHSN